MDSELNNNNNENNNKNKKESEINKSTIENAISYISRGIRAAEKEQSREFSKNELIDLEKKIAYEYAISYDLWIPNENLPKPIAGGGNENSLYYDESKGVIYKSNNLFNNNFSILNFLEYILNHNKLFEKTEYKFIGFNGLANNRSIPYIEPIVSQKYIIGNSATLEEIQKHFESIDFERINDYTYRKNEYIVSDLKPRNVIKSIYGDIYIIDNIISTIHNNLKNTYSNGGNTNIFELTSFRVSAETERDSNELYFGFDIDRAELEFNSANISDFPDYGGTVMFMNKTDKYKFVGDLEDGYYEISDFPIEDYFNDRNYYKLIEEGEYEEFKNKVVDPVNESSDKLLNDVESHYKNIYGKWKYNKIVVDNGKDYYDDDYMEYGCIQLRVANHSENVKNIDKLGDCDYYISVVIADKDNTKGKFLASMFERRSNEIEFSFNSDNNFDEIILEVDEEIERAKEYILSKNKMKNGGELKNQSINNLYKDHHEVWAESEKIIKDVCKENCSKYSKKIYHLYELELKPHFEEEESDFFPKVINEKNRKAIEGLIKEHKTIADLCKKIRLHERTSDIKVFCKLIINHIKKEEEIMNEITPDPYKKEENKDFKYYLVLKNKKPIFKVRFSKYNKDTEKDMSAMLDKLHDMDYMLKLISEKEYNEFDYKNVNKEDVAEFTRNWTFYKDGGVITDEQEETYQKWKKLVNMTSSELKKFLDSEEGKIAGLTEKEADELGIDYGRESAKWILKMKAIPYKEWTPNMWRWAKKQIWFISRMSGNKGKLYDEKGKRTRKYLSLLVWGNNPLKK